MFVYILKYNPAKKQISHLWPDPEKNELKKKKKKNPPFSPPPKKKKKKKKKKKPHTQS